MKIQKGIVKYKDRNDIVCTYGVTDDGKQYYFLDENDEKRLANGGRIASTELVEAIDPMVKASHIGVVGADGHEIIPFVNKSIRQINDGTLLVEVSQPVSPSVLEAISLKSDPLAAAKLVSTPAAIKEKLNAKIGSEGRYLINDQFSEATICDINGNNLINDELYSFACIGNGTVYLSKNVVDSEIKEFSLLPPEEQNEVVNNEEVNMTNEIDVTNVNVESSLIDKAMEDAGFNEVPPIVEEKEETVEPVNDEIEIPTVEEENSDDSFALENNEETIPVVEEETYEEVNDNNDIVSLGEDNVVEETPISEDVVSDETDNSDVEFNSDEDDSMDDFSTIEDEGESNDEVQISFSEPQTASLPSVEDSLAEGDDDQAIPDIFDGKFDQINNNSFDEVENEMEDSSYKIDKIETDDYYNEEFDNSYVDSASDSIMSDVAKSLANLMKQNRNQKEIISDYKDKFDKLNASRRVIVEKAKMQEQKIESLTNKNRSNENTISKLEAKLQMLESRIRDQEKVIANQSKELESIKPQKDDLAKLVADAQALLGDEASYEYDNSYYDRAA